MGGYKGVNDISNAAFQDVNPGLKFASIGRRGFYVVTATKQQAITNYYGFDAETMLQSFEEARGNGNQATSRAVGTAIVDNGQLTAAFTCDAQLVTTAGEKGSLEKVDESCTAKFDSERPAVWDIPLPARAEDDPGLKSFENCGMDSCTVDVGENTVAPSGVKDIFLSSLICVFVCILAAF